MVPRPPDPARVRIAALVALLGLAVLTGCSHGPKPTASAPEPQHRDSKVPSDPGLERDASRDDDDDDDDDDDRKQTRRARPGTGYAERGIASYYANKFEGRITASGDRYRGREMTAAHKTLPFGTRIRVTELSSGRSVEVVVNDRGPHRKGRIVDLSRSAAEEIGLIAKGLTKVLVEVIEHAGNESAARD